jgi:MFS family permease
MHFCKFLYHQFMMIFGILTSYILGSFLNWRYLSMACGLISIPSLFLLAFAPDSPVWLISQGRSDEAHAILERLHGSKKAVTLLRQAQDKISQEVIRRQKNDGINKRRLDMTMVKASAVALGILSFQQLTGKYLLSFYYRN